MSGYPGNGGGGEAVEIAYCSYTTDPNLTLTTTLQKVVGWAASATPQKISEVGGTFTVSFSGVAKIDLERIYANGDSNPADVVILQIQVKKNGLVMFDRTAPISTATPSGGDGIQTFTTPFIDDDATTGDEYEIFVAASDGGANPSDTRLSKMKVVVNNIHNKV